MKRFSEMSGQKLWEDWQEFSKEIINDPEKKEKYLSILGNCDALILDNDLILKAWLSHISDHGSKVKAKHVGWDVSDDMYIPEHLVGKILIRMPGYDILQFYVREF